MVIQPTTTHTLPGQGGRPRGSPPLEIAASVPAGSDIIIRLVGELDLSNATVVQNQLADTLTCRPDAAVVFDLSELLFMDCAGLAVMLKMRCVVVAGRRQLTLRGVRPCVEMLIRVSHHEDLLPPPRRRGSDHYGGH